MGNYAPYAYTGKYLGIDLDEKPKWKAHMNPMDWTNQKTPREYNFSLYICYFITTSKRHDKRTRNK